MEGQTIHDALNERWSFTSTGALDCFLDGQVDGKDIIAVYLDTGNTVDQRLLGQGMRLGLLPARHRNGPVVVLAQENRRRVEHTRKVEAFMKIPLGGRAVAKKYQAYVRLLAIFHAVHQNDGSGA